MSRNAAADFALSVARNLNVATITQLNLAVKGARRTMRRYTIIVMLALGVLLTMWQYPVAQSARDADFDANGIVNFGDFTVGECAQGLYSLKVTINDRNSGQSAEKDVVFVIAR